MAICQLTLTSFAMVLGLSVSSQPSSKPNIIVILADDLVRLIQGCDPVEYTARVFKPGL
jgi:hypothetical protein